MIFPESERVLYTTNPLVEVVCQFRFPTILRIREGQLAGFQDKIRKDYPIYSEQEPSFGLPQQAPRELAAIFEQIKIPIPPALVTHRFYTKDSLRFISLSDEFMAVAATRYERWESFREELIKIERALQEIFEPNFYTRIGLRYRDLISRRSLKLTNVKWQELLQPYIIAELGDENVSDAISKIQIRTVIKISEIPDGQITLIHGLSKPPGSDEECYMIDADFSVERKEGVGEPFEILDRFNRLAGRLFRWAITERLYSAMGPRTI